MSEHRFVYSRCDPSSPISCHSVATWSNFGDFTSADAKKSPRNGQVAKVGRVLPKRRTLDAYRRRCLASPASIEGPVGVHETHLTVVVADPRAVVGQADLFGDPPRPQVGFGDTGDDRRVAIVFDGNGDRGACQFCGVAVAPCRYRQAVCSGRPRPAGVVAPGVVLMSESSTAVGAVVLPGRLGDSEMSLATDPRSDPRLVAALAPFGLDVHGAEPPVTLKSPREAALEFIGQAEQGFETVFAALFDGLPAVEGVSAETRVVTGVDGNHIPLYIHRPTRSNGPVPCVFHIHGGGMVMLEAAGAAYSRWRDELAASGLIVVGVEFRNGAGKLGTHPFPAGLNDCADGLRWVIENQDELGTSNVVVSGESGGGNLTLAVTHKAKREGWLADIDGVYAQCPYISNAWATKPADLPSLHENDEYFIGCKLMGVLAAAYDPTGEHANDPTCWRYQATVDDLVGMPPHVISVNELDPLRDEGLAYYRKLLAAAVPTYSRTVNGTCHAGDVIFRRDMPEVHAATIHDVKSFADSL
jgi:acetyl esterase